MSTAFRVESHGRTLETRFELAEHPELQVYDVSIYAHLLSDSLGILLRQGTIAEPRATLPGIAQRYAEATTDAAKKNQGRKRLKSYPLVPPNIPSGKSVTSTSADWAAWKPLSIELSDPQSFQYEIVADKSGSEADIVARADLLGNGNVTIVKVHVAIDPKSHEIVVGDVVEEPKKCK